MIDPTAKIHPKALVDEGAIVGPETRIWAFTHLLPGARVGTGCNLCDGVYVEGQVVIGDQVTVKNGVALYDGVTVEDEVFIGPNAVFTNDLMPRAGRYKGTPKQFKRTLLCRGCSIGANAVIVCGHQVGEYALVAAGAVVTHDVPPYTIVQGNPARPAGRVCACARKLDPYGAAGGAERRGTLDASLICSCGLRYREVDGRVAPA